MAAKPTDEGSKELEQVLQELKELLGSEPLSKTTPEFGRVLPFLNGAGVQLCACVLS
jgi:hypothetical protein